MSQANVDLIRGLYDAFAAGDIAGVLGRMSPDIVWNEAENFPYADNSPYRGPEGVLNGVFARIGAEWDGFAAIPEGMIDGGDTVIALGRYRGTYRATGRARSRRWSTISTTVAARTTPRRRWNRASRCSSTASPRAAS